MNNSNTNNLNCPVIVPFHGNNLYLVNSNNEPFVPMKPIVEGMGLDWKSQYSKLKQKFNTCMVEITIQLPNDIQNRLVSCLSLRKLPAWLYSIQPNKVKPELRDDVIKYQEECDEVLWQYWTKGQVTKESVKTVLPKHIGLAEYRKARAISMATKSAEVICNRFDNLSKPSQQVIFAKMVNSSVNEELIPLPILENKTFSASEVGEMLGVSSNKIGRIANEINLKTEEYGIFVLDKSRSSDKQVESFRYNEKAIDVLKNHLINKEIA